MSGGSVRENYRKFIFVVCVILTVSVFYFSVTPGETLDGESYSIQNSGVLMHILAYSVLTLSYGFYFYFSLAIIPAALEAGKIAFSYSLFIEVVQFFIPYRAFEFGDIGINFLAIFVSCVGLLLLLKAKEYFILPIGSK